MSKKLLEDKLIGFQKKIIELSHDLKMEKAESFDREKEFVLEILDVLDAFENIFANLQDKEDGFEKSVKKTMNSFRAIHRKLTRLLESLEIEKIEFMDGKALPGLCKVVDAKEDPQHENGTIVTIIRNGYHKNDFIYRPAEVITVANDKTDENQNMTNRSEVNRLDTTEKPD